MIINKCQNCLITQTFRVYKPSSVCVSVLTFHEDEAILSNLAGSAGFNIFGATTTLYFTIITTREKQLLPVIHPFVFFVNTVAFRKLSLQSLGTITRYLLWNTNPKKTKQPTCQTQQPGAVICCRRFALGEFMFCIKPNRQYEEIGPSLGGGDPSILFV